MSELTPEDWGQLYGANIFSDPAGMLLLELYEKVTRLGFEIAHQHHAPKANYGLVDLIACLDDDEIQANFSSQTVRAVRQRLKTWHGDQLFQSDVGTPVTELVKAGELSILCLNRMSEDLRSVITGVLVRKIKAARTRGSQLERRRAFDGALSSDALAEMPRIILAIDEAQMIIPASGGGPARKAIDSYILLAQVAHWIGGGSEALTVDPNELSSSPSQPQTKATKSKLKPLGLGDAEQLIRLLALLVDEAGYSGLCLAIDEIELIAGQHSRRRNNSFQTLRELVDQSDDNLMPPSTCLYLAATPDMFENPDLFPSYKALQDRIEELPSLMGAGKINYRAPVVNLDATELTEADLRVLADNVVRVFVAANGDAPGDTASRIDEIVAAIVKGNYVIARPRLLCRCMVDLLEGRLGDDLRKELATRTEEMRKKREREIKGK